MNFDEIENEIQEVSKREHLYSLFNFDEVTFDGENALGFLSRINKTRNHLKQNGVDFDLLTSDLINSISSDVRYSIAKACIYFPYANNFLSETMPFGTTGVVAPTYFIKVGDKRFFYYINTSFEKLYIFWDRIGDILSLAFNLGLHDRDVYFSKVIPLLSDRLESNEHGRWLKNFHDEEYKKILNRLRIRIVHYEQKDSYFFTEFLKLASTYNDDPSKLAELQREKEELLPLLKRQLDLANEGFEKMVRFIAESGVYERD